jgi:FkbM family methyltransferase
MPLTNETVSDFINRLSDARQLDPALFLKGLALFQDVRDASMRHVRAEALHTVLLKLRELIETTGFADRLVVRPDGIYVDIDGVLLDTLSNRLYLKGSGARQRNIAGEMAGILQKFGIALNTIVDIGANYGEASLWFARNCPKARIIAVEPSSANRAVFERNRSAQDFPTGNIEVWPEAVLDRSGSVWLTAGVGTMNRISFQPVENTEQVRCEKLENLFRERGVASADFVKIDIEGAEPRLKESLLTLGRRIRAYFIEFSKFAPLEEYVSLGEALIGAGFRCYDTDGSRPLAGGRELQNHLKQVLVDKNAIATNLWFVGA